MPLEKLAIHSLKSSSASSSSINTFKAPITSAMISASVGAISSLTLHQHLHHLQDFHGTGLMELHWDVSSIIHQLQIATLQNQHL